MTENRKIAGVIFSGGKAERMGQPKGLVQVRGQPMISHMVDWLTPACSSVALASGADGPLYKDLGLPCLDDMPAGQQGPAAGLLAGFHWAKSVGADLLLTGPCDMPFLPDDLVGRMVMACSGHPVYARSSLGNHYAVAVWPVACAAAVEKQILQDGERALHRILSKNDARALAHDDDQAFADINKLQDIVDQ